MRRISFYSIALMLLLGSLTTSFQKASAQTQEKDVIFIIPEQMPSSPGGEAAAIEYLNNNARHPENTKKKKNQGHVFANFDVEKDGSIEDVHVLQSTDPSLAEEIIRVIKSMPKWTLGRQNGQTVRVRLIVAATFTKKRIHFTL